MNKNLFVVAGVFLIGLGFILLSFENKNFFWPGVVILVVDFVVLFNLLSKTERLKLHQTYSSEKKTKPKIISEKVSLVGDEKALKVREAQEKRLKEKKKVVVARECFYCGMTIFQENTCPFCKMSLSKVESLRKLREEKGRIEEDLETLKKKFISGKISEESHKKLTEQWVLKLADIEEKIIELELKKGGDT
ncbi:MAG: hypothetical protein ACE5K0_09780 [Candidatus Methanofastidiosia archaeon]